MQDDLEDLIRELNASAAPPDTAEAATAPAKTPLDGEPLWQPGAAPPASSSPMSPAPSSARLESWLAVMMERRASDLLLVSGAPPVLRVDGRVAPMEGAAIDAGPLDGVDIEEAVYAALAPHAQKQYRETGIADASFRMRGLGRFRINLHRERGRAASTIRALPASVPRLASLGLPTSVELLSRLPRGLVLIGGPTGSGKSTTLAALVEEINRRDARHIITIEDPIEYEHTHKQSIVEQVEIGVDAPDFPTALRAALRQAPDVIVVGEMRDPETMRIALAAGETGHLVLSSIHTTDIGSTVSRVSDSFPAERQNTIRQELSMALAAVMTQTLLPKIGGGRAVAAEMLLVSYGARQHIRKNALQHLHQEITITRKLGSFSIEESLARLVRDGLVERSEAQGRALHPDELDNALR
jgi:twitching motility protein PilT